MATARSVGHRGHVWYHGILAMWSLIKNVSRVALIYRYRFVILRCALCFFIFAVMELLFDKWQLVITQLEISTQSTILVLYSLAQLLLLLVVIISLTRSNKLESKTHLRKRNTDTTPLQRSPLKGDSHEPPKEHRDQLEQFLDTKQYPDLNIFQHDKTTKTK